MYCLFEQYLDGISVHGVFRIVVIYNSRRFKTEPALIDPVKLFLEEINVARVFDSVGFHTSQCCIIVDFDFCDDIPVVAHCFVLSKITFPAFQAPLLQAIS